MAKNIFPQFGTNPLKNVPILKQTQKNHYSLRYIRVDRPAFFNAILTNEGTIGGAVGAANTHEPFVFSQVVSFFFPKSE